jgi:hypothetical protein
MFLNKSSTSSFDRTRTGITVVDALLSFSHAKQDDRELDQCFPFCFT